MHRLGLVLTVQLRVVWLIISILCASWPNPSPFKRQRMHHTVKVSALQPAQLVVHVVYKYLSTFFFFFCKHIYFPASEQAVVTLLPPGSCLQFFSRIRFSNLIAHQFFIECLLLTHALALSASQHYFHRVNHSFACHFQWSVNHGRSSSKTCDGSFVSPSLPYQSESATIFSRYRCQSLGLASRSGRRHPQKPSIL